MTGYYPYVVTALLLIYAHSTSQMNLSYDTGQIQRELLHEDSYVRSLLKSYSRAILHSDIVCQYDHDTKQEMCDDAMVVVITKQHGKGTFGVFLPAEADLPAPALANQIDPYRCETISIDGANVKNPMFWCMDRKYRNAKTGGIDEAKGFFMSVSEKVVDEVFMFRPSETGGGKVSMWAKINKFSTIGRTPRE